MSARVTVTDLEVFSETAPDEPATKGGVVYRKGGVEDLFVPALRNEHIEGGEYRGPLKPGEGAFCITMEPGDQLGDIVFNVQYEGPKGKWDQCMEQQNDVLDRFCEWLKGILSELNPDASFLIRIRGAPCPKSEVELQVSAAAERLREVRRTGGPKIDLATRHDVQVTKEVRRGQSA